MVSHKLGIVSVCPVRADYLLIPAAILACLANADFFWTKPDCFGQTACFRYTKSTGAVMVARL